MGYKGTTTLITGASAGLGEEFARQLAQQGANLVLVARSKGKLERLATELRQQTEVEVTVIPADLGSSDAVERLISQVKDRGRKIHLLINNAGLGVFENFLDTSPAKQMNQVSVNISAVVALSHAFAPEMTASHRGGLINIASTAGFQPLAGAAVYAASKAFVLLFSEALSLELEKSGVRVLVACPGPMATQFFAEMKPSLEANQMAQPRQVVAEILWAFEHRKRVVYPGKIAGRLSTWGARLMPRNLILRLAAGTVKKLNRK
ncbi:MAG: SDR family oxidoreductase [Candidatus Sulfotelmatobacter sp.]